MRIEHDFEYPAHWMDNKQALNYINEWIKDEYSLMAVLDVVRDLHL